MENDQRVDAYIANAAPFAQPVLTHLRELVHTACPEVVETIKWGFPHFEYHGILVSMAAFKQHCAFTFWKGDLLRDPHGVLDKARTQSMGQMGKLMSLADLPSDEIMIALIREAMTLNEQGVRLPRKPQSATNK